ncbi:hypothetical protein PG991_001465 [Apiospora marii]|uniref:Uncharacterized protein n=1 Tax=Apiospora marii TaxID=335849 RepID=A0ABR1SS53_9PEZI
MLGSTHTFTVTSITQTAWGSTYLQRLGGEYTSGGTLTFYTNGTGPFLTDINDQTTSCVHAGHLHITARNPDLDSLPVRSELEGQHGLQTGGGRIDHFDASQRNRDPPPHGHGDREHRRSLARPRVLASMDRRRRDRTGSGMRPGRPSGLVDHPAQDEESLGGDGGRIGRVDRWPLPQKPATGTLAGGVTVALAWAKRAISGLGRS